MRKHLISAIAALALLLTVMLPAAAVAPGISNAALRQFRAGYIQDGKAYVYLQLEQNQLANIQLQLKVNETVIEQQSSGFIKEGDKSVHYLLLVDCSSTVRSYKEQISLFACGVLEQTIAGGGAAVGAQGADPRRGGLDRGLYRHQPALAAQPRGLLLGRGAGAG